MWFAISFFVTFIAAVLLVAAMFQYERIITCKNEYLVDLFDQRFLTCVVAVLFPLDEPRTKRDPARPAKSVVIQNKPSEPKLQSLEDLLVENFPGEDLFASRLAKTLNKEFTRKGFVWLLGYPSSGKHSAVNAFLVSHYGSQPQSSRRQLCTQFVDIVDERSVSQALSFSKTIKDCPAGAVLVISNFLKHAARFPQLVSNLTKTKEWIKLASSLLVLIDDIGIAGSTTDDMHLHPNIGETEAQDFLQVSLQQKGVFVHLPENVTVVPFVPKNSRTLEAQLAKTCAEVNRDFGSISKVVCDTLSLAQVTVVMERCLRYGGYKKFRDEFKEALQSALKTYKQTDSLVSSVKLQIEPPSLSEMDPCVNPRYNEWIKIVSIEAF